MATYKRKVAFSETEAGIEALEILRIMDGDTKFNTPSSYCANSELYPENLRPFVDKHMDYLSTHPNVNSRQYLSNLRLTTRVR